MRKLRVLLTGIIVSTMLFANVVQAGVLFPDVADDTWYVNHVEAVAKAGIIIGNSKGEFMPMGTLNADQFIKTMVVAAGHDVGNGDSYWASKYIEKARELKIIDEKEYFTQEISSQPITRAQMAKLIQRVLYYLEGDYNYTKRDAIMAYIPDNGDVVASGYKDYIYQVYERGIITGDSLGNFKPFDTVTRAEASAVLHRIIDESVRKPFVDSKIDTGVTYDVLEMDHETYNAIYLDITYYIPTQYELADDFIGGFISDETKSEIMEYVKGKTDRRQILDPKFWYEGKYTVRVISKWLKKHIYIEIWEQK